MEAVGAKLVEPDALIYAPLRCFYSCLRRARSRTGTQRPPPGSAGVPARVQNVLRGPRVAPFPRNGPFARMRHPWGAAWVSKKGFCESG